MIQPNLALGIGFHGVGAFLAANCYAPQKYVKGWAWEIFWMTQAAWCWLLWPILGALLTIPNLARVLANSPADRMALAFLMGVAYGVGGTAFNISIRYIGFALTYSIAVGLSSILGTLMPPLLRGEIGAIIQRPGASWVLSGVAMGAVGIAICGAAGRLKETSLDPSVRKHSEFSLSKGLLLSLVAGVLSAVYGMGLDTAAPIADVAERYGAGIWKGNISYLFVNTGAFLTSFVYSLRLARRNRTIGELSKPSDEGRGQLSRNHVLAFLTGTLWYGQFFFYNLGHVRLGAQYAFSSWAIHMILLVLLSNLSALVFREWKHCSRLTRVIMGAGVVVLCAAVLMLTYGNRLGEA